MAGIAAGLLLVLLLPTFNALNNSYVEHVKPPPWVPTPSTIPDVTPPSNFDPPPDMTPPTGMTPPTNLPPPPKDGRIPPGASCPNPKIEWHNQTLSMQTPGPFRQTMSFALTNKTVYLEGYVNVTNWQAQSVASTLSGPKGFAEWSNNEPGSTGIFATTTPATSWHYQSYNNTSGGKVPPAGNYDLSMQAAGTVINGQWDVQFAALVCGVGK